MLDGESIPMVTITLAGPPQGKGRPRFVRSTGMAFTPAKTRSYEGALRHEAAIAMAGIIPLAGALAVNVTATFAVAASWSRKEREAALAGSIRPTKTPDADNLLKTLDAFNGIVWADDKQVVDVRVVKLYGERPGLTVEVRALA